MVEKILTKIEKLLQKKNSIPFKIFKKRGLYMGQNPNEYEY